jgi:HPt (histidine-containing phosphotransfer) domain-containing protein
VSTPDGIDAEPLEKIRLAGGDELAQKIQQLFLLHGPKRIATARDAAATGDADALERSMHALKSSAAQLGAMRLAAICRDLEDRARQHDLAAAEALVVSAEVAMADYARWAGASRA